MRTNSLLLPFLLTTSATGVLAIDELMIESVAGTGDYGQWIEIGNTASCAVDLSGLHAECPVGSKVRTLDVGEDVWIASGGRFVIADSTDPALRARDCWSLRASG